MSTENKKTVSRAANRRKKLIGGLVAAVVLAAVVVTVVAVAGGSDSRSGTLMTINGKLYDIKPGANLAGANLSGANLASIDLSGADLSGANLTGANLNGTNLTGTKFGCINLGGTLTCANFTNLKASAIVGTPFPLPTGWVLKSGFLLGPTVNLSGLSFRNTTTLQAVDLTGANLTVANLRGASLANAILVNANLTGALASGENVEGTAPTSFSGVTWGNTLCVNGSNSNVYNTCLNIGY